MEQKEALVIVDMQVDFCPGGALPVVGGDSVVPILNLYIDIFIERGLPVYATRDYHPEKTRHFKAYGGEWPPHCVQGTEGAEFHAELKLPWDAIIITKGASPDEDAYSGFQGHDDKGRTLAESLKSQGVTGIYVGGLATDYCVKATVLDGLREGFAVSLLVDAVRGVELKEGDTEKAIMEMKTKGARMITIKEIKL